MHMHCAMCVCVCAHVLTTVCHTCADCMLLVDGVCMVAGDPQQSAAVGSYVGGSNCVFSHACLVKV